MAIDAKGRWVFALVADSNNQQQLVSIARNADGSPGNVSNGESLFNQKCNSNPALPNIAIDPQGPKTFISCDPLNPAVLDRQKTYSENRSVKVCAPA